MKSIHTILLTGMISLLSTSVYAESISVDVHLIDKKSQEKNIGSIYFSDTQYGLLITPHLNSLSPGLHGLHIHEHPNCAQEGMAAGSHVGQKKKNKHAGPYSDKGHLGDLPALFVNVNGEADHVELAPRLKASDLKNHAIIVHAGGDNYSDQPSMGGGGARIACGVIK